MKTIRKLLIAGLLITLTACGSKTETPAADTTAEQPTAEAQPEESSDSSAVVESAYGKAEGAMGNIMRATNLEFTLNSAYLTSSYQTLTPA